MEHPQLVGTYICKTASPPGVDPIVADLQLYHGRGQTQSPKALHLSSKKNEFGDSNWKNPSLCYVGSYYYVFDQAQLGTPIYNQFITELIIPCANE